MVIELRDIHFSYPEGKKVFSGLDFSLRKGERVGIIGQNGSGKTTLLHLIMGLLKPHQGEINIFGKIRRYDEDFQDVRQRVGLLFQNSDDQLFCPSVEEDIAFGPLNLGKSQAEARTIARKTCDILGLNGLEKKITYRLSGGEKRLVALATVVAMNPECYLLDEPSAGLDEATNARLLHYLRDFSDTYVIITHDRNFLKKATDRIYLLENSRIVTFS